MISGPFSTRMVLGDRRYHVRPLALALRHGQRRTRASGSGSCGKHAGDELGQRELEENEPVAGKLEHISELIRGVTSGYMLGGVRAAGEVAMQVHLLILGLVTQVSNDLRNCCGDRLRVYLWTASQAQPRDNRAIVQLQHRSVSTCS